MHGISDARAEHRVHLCSDGLDALESLQLRTQMTQMCQSRVCHTSRDEDIAEGIIQLVGDILVIRQNPTGQISDLLDRTYNYQLI